MGKPLSAGRQYHLCLSCTVTLDEAYTLSPVPGCTHDNDTCALCGVRRFGRRYLIQRRSRT